MHQKQNNNKGNGMGFGNDDNDSNKNANMVTNDYAESARVAVGFCIIYGKWSERGERTRAHPHIRAPSLKICWNVCAYDMAFVRNNVCDDENDWAWSWIIIGKNITFYIINNRFVLINAKLQQRERLVPFDIGRQHAAAAAAACWPKNLLSSPDQTGDDYAIPKSLLVDTKLWCLTLGGWLADQPSIVIFAEKSTAHFERKWAKEMQ